MPQINVISLVQYNTDILVIVMENVYLTIASEKTG